MRAISYSKALAALVVVTASLNATPAAVRAQSAQTAGPEIEIDARLVATSREGMGMLGLDWGTVDPSVAGMRLGSATGGRELDEAFSTMERAGRGKVLAAPRLLLPNNTEGAILQGVQVPVQTIANNTVTVSWKDSSLHLKVRPEVVSGKLLDMHLRVENAGGLEVAPKNYTVRVAEGDTTVVGGIVLDGPKTAGREVLVFLTPRIVE